MSVFLLVDFSIDNPLPLIISLTIGEWKLGEALIVLQSTEFQLVVAATPGRFRFPRLASAAKAAWKPLQLRTSFHFWKALVLHCTYHVFFYKAVIFLRRGQIYRWSIFSSTKVEFGGFDG